MDLRCLQVSLLAQCREKFLFFFADNKQNITLIHLLRHLCLSPHLLFKSGFLKHVFFSSHKALKGVVSQEKDKWQRECVSVKGLIDAFKC